MVALEFNPIYESILVFLLAIIPGVAIGWPLMKKSKLSLLERSVFSFFVGLFAVPTLLYMETFIGLKFSLFLVAMNFLLTVTAGVLWGLSNGAFNFVMPELTLGKDFEEPLEFARKHAASMLLLLAILLAFWIRVQTYTPIYSELDPYWYVFATGQIIQHGAVPLSDDTAWYPDATSSHRGNALRAYTEAQWYSVYTKGGAFDNYLLYDVAGWLPPISGALLVFGAYLALNGMFGGKRYGILAAFIMAFLPIAVYKMSAGVNEAVPIGVMALFMCMGAYIHALVKKDEAVAALAGFAYFVIINASNYSPVMTIPFGLFMVLQSIDYFARGKWNEEFFRISAYVFAGFMLATFAVNLNTTDSLFKSVTGLFTGSTLLVIGGFALAAFINHFLHKRIKEKIRLQIVAVGAVLLLIAFFFTPVGAFTKGFVVNYVGAAQFNFPLDKTIAEQNVAGTNFEGEGGFITLVPYAHMPTPPAKAYAPATTGAADIRANPFDYLASAAGYMVSVIPYAAGQLVKFKLDAVGYSLLELVSVPATYVGSVMLGSIDFFFNRMFGTTIATGTKDDSLLFFFVTIFTLGSIAVHFMRKGESRETPSVLMLSLLFIFPVLYVGLNKLKFTIFAGIMTAYAAAIAMGLVEKAARKLADRLKLIDMESLGRVFIAILFVMVLLQAATPSPLMISILSKSFEVRYQDNPAAVAPKLASMCEELRKVGYYDADICSAGYDKTYADTINGQFNSKVCLVSQLTVSELLPKTAAEQSAADYAKGGASFRCNRLSDYWIETMEWVKNNLNDTDRVNSWWDYGHWTNYFGEKYTVLRNEHSSRYMIGRVAHDFVLGSTQDLVDSMNYFDSRYVMLDTEIIGGSSFGGKYGALNYLGCAHEGLTSVAQDPGTSKCEYDHSPERLLIPKVQVAGNTCTISESQRLTGVYAYPVNMQGVDLPRPSYCVGETTLSDGSKITATYYLNRKNADGDLVLSKGFIRTLQDYGDSVHVEKVYNEQPVWPGPNGTWVGSMEDATTDFYRSNLYKGYYLENLPGFELVFKSKGGEVKIFRMTNFTGNTQPRSTDNANDKS